MLRTRSTGQVSKNSDQISGFPMFWRLVLGGAGGSEVVATDEDPCSSMSFVSIRVRRFMLSAPRQILGEPCSALIVESPQVVGAH